MKTLYEILFEIKHRHGFLTDGHIQDLARVDRLRQVLIRCGGCRLLCAAQDALHLIDLIETGKDANGLGDYIRDVSLPASDPLYRNDYLTRTTPAHDQPQPLAQSRPVEKAKASIERALVPDDAFDDYGGAFDGFNVTSDADPGL